MKNLSQFRYFLWPVLLFAASIAAYASLEPLFQHFAPEADRMPAHRISMTFLYFSGAWLLARIIVAVLRKNRNGSRKVPKLLGELITAALFLAATAATIAMLLGQSAGGALASSGLIIAILGFAIRNVLADVLSGVALGLEAPFRIGDWIEIDGTIRGKVIEIGWRTTRLLTRNDTYMILPNSQISRQRMTNFSAPKRHYRATLEIVLGHDISVSQGKELLATAAASTKSVMKSPKPDVRALSYDTHGVRYTVRYWVPSFVDDIVCGTRCSWPPTPPSANVAFRLPTAGSSWCRRNPGRTNERPRYRRAFAQTTAHDRWRIQWNPAAEGALSFMKNLPPQGPAGAQDHPVKVTIRSWYLARALGVTTKPPDIGAEYIEVRVEGGPPLFWTVIGRPESATPQE